MTREIQCPLAVRLSTIGGMLLLAVFLYSGCSDSQADPLSGRDTNLKPDDGEAKSSSLDEDEAINRFASRVNGKLPGKPSAAVPVTADPLEREIPKDPKEILAYILQLQHRPPPRNLEESELMLMALEKTVTAGEKLIAATDDPEMIKAGTLAKFRALSQSAGLGVTDSEQRLEQFCQELSKSDDVPAYEVELALFAVAVSRFRRDESKFDACLSKLDALAKKHDRPMEHLSMADSLSATLMQDRRSEEAAAVMKLIGDLFKDHEDEKVAAQATRLLTQAEQVGLSAKFAALGIEAKLVEAAKGDAKAADEVIGIVEKMLAEEPLDRNLFGFAAHPGWFFEITQHYEASAKAYDTVAKAYQDVDDEEVTALVDKTLGNARRRLALVGKPLTLHTVNLDGKPFDWSQYKDKAVLVFCWATTFESSFEELANVVQHYDRYREQGFEVASLNFDDDHEALKAFLERAELPWPTQISADSVGVGLESALATQLGIDSLPFSVLIGPDGKVIALHAMRSELTNQLTTLFGSDEEVVPSAESNPSNDGDKPEPVEPEPIEGEPKTQTPAKESTDQPPGPEGEGAAYQYGPELEYFVSFDGSDELGECDDETDQPRNPYLAPSGLTTSQLVDYVLDMEEKPDPIKNRPGFAEAVIEAAERLIKNETEGGTYWRIGVVTKFKYLHRQAANDDKEADKELVTLLEKFEDNTDKRIAREVRFLQMERRVLEGTKLPIEDIEAFLTELKDYYATQRLSDRHLRMASATVALINRIDSEDADKKDELGDKREKYFTEFGELFAKSSNRELKDYGNKLAKKPDDSGGGTVASDLVGKPLELGGQTAAGKDFDWKSYRGKVVIVDFWATWCGPCIREMPHVREFFEKNHERGFEVVGVSLDKDLAALDKFIEDRKVPWENLSGDGTQALATKYGVRGIPTMMLIDRDGNVVAVSHNIAALTGKADELLGMASPMKKPADAPKSEGSEPSDS